MRGGNANIVNGRKRREAEDLSGCRAFIEEKAEWKGRGMEKESRKRILMDEAYRLGFENEKIYRGCSQCIVAAVQDTLGIRDDSIFKAATGLSAGGASTGMGSCGAFVGGVMVLSQVCGRERDKFDDPERIRTKTSELAKRLFDSFIQDYGSIICRDIQTRIFGRPFYLRDPEERKKFDEAGGHSDKCPDVVGKAARRVVEIILDEGLIKK
jgi:C_GCAxxG_C_C family probable redox protein